MRRGLLSRIAENRANNEQKTVVNNTSDKEDLKQFEFGGKTYYVAQREDVLVFDSNMILVYTLTMQQLAESELPLIQKVYEIIENKNDEPKVILFIKRNGRFEKISFYNRFDAIFILKKMKRVALRPDENIEELFIEDDGAIVEHHKINPQRRFRRGFFKNRKNSESEIAVTLSDAEDALESIINKTINDPERKIKNEEIDKCIALLESVKSSTEE